MDGERVNSREKKALRMVKKKPAAAGGVPRQPFGPESVRTQSLSEQGSAYFMYMQWGMQEN